MSLTSNKEGFMKQIVIPSFIHRCTKSDKCGLGTEACIAFTNLGSRPETCLFPSRPGSPAIWRKMSATAFAVHLLKGDKNEKD